MHDSNLLHGDPQRIFFSARFSIRLFVCVVCALLAPLLRFGVCVCVLCPSCLLALFLPLIGGLRFVVFGVLCALFAFASFAFVFAFCCRMRFLCFILKWCGAKCRSPQCSNTQVCSPVDTILVLTGLFPTTFWHILCNIAVSIPIDHIRCSLPSISH